MKRVVQEIATVISFEEKPGGLYDVMPARDMQVAEYPVPVPTFPVVKRFYFSRTVHNPFADRYMVSGVIQGESLEAVQAAMDEAFRQRGGLDSHRSFAFQDLDEVKDPVGGILATTMMG